MSRYLWLIPVVVVLLTACSEREAGNQSPTLAPSPTTTSGGATPLPTVPTPSRLYTHEELQRNTIAFKQKTGLGVDKPVLGKNFSLEYDGYATAYYVAIQAATLTEYRQTKPEAEKAFKDVGVGDLCSIKIYFVPPKNLGNQPTVADGLATGCRPYQ